MKMETDSISCIISSITIGKYIRLCGRTNLYRPK